MPINTRIDGNPDSVAATGSWLRNHLAATVHDTTATLSRARELACATWSGPAAAAFTTRMDTIRRNCDALADGAGAAAAEFGELAAALCGAQDGMARARGIATAGGLTVTDGVIAEPTVPPQCFVDPVLEAASMARHQRQVDAYTAARTEARRAVEILAAAVRAAVAVWDEIRSKPYLSAADFVGKSAKVYVDRHVSALTGEANRLRDQAFTAQQRSLAVPAGSSDAAFHDQIRGEASKQADLTRERIGTGALGRAVLDALDKGVTAGQIAVDIAHGKPQGQAIVSNTVAAAAGDAAAQATTRLLTVRGVGIAATAVLTGGAGLVLGTAAGVLADAVWNHLVPHDIRDKINKGAQALLDAGKKLITNTWHAAENLAESLWHALF
ncbi:hypothetical protein [Amycolatopsis sp. CA-230715]|uniref:hypothetical protein n=1 Tax=Amycolatopsis sp. CA-230715 TaxID=2745196 RepID=UPI001C025275|nr:hypothetical protein [Amycolatopsis sp. CA-230715]QWF85633.1 hypothetical protein HUW46_09088 [Amycolatopsis sp. CA-230715]